MASKTALWRSAVDVFNPFKHTLKSRAFGEKFVIPPSGTIQVPQKFAEKLRANSRRKRTGEALIIYPLGEAPNSDKDVDARKWTRSQKVEAVKHIPGRPDWILVQELSDEELIAVWESRDWGVLTPAGVSKKAVVRMRPSDVQKRQKEEEEEKDKQEDTGPISVGGALAAEVETPKLEDAEDRKKRVASRMRSK